MAHDPLTFRPRVRDDVRRIRQVERGEVVYIYKAEGADEYYRLDEIQHSILSLVDGTRTLEEIARDFNAGSPAMTIDVDFLADYLQNMRSTAILEKTREEKRRLFLEKMRDDRLRRAKSRDALGNVFDLTLSAWDPDSFFERVLPHIRFFWTRGFIVLSAASMLLMLAIWADRWDTIRRGTVELFTFSGKSGIDVLYFFLTLLIIGFFHECAHGLTCKYFGGQVRRMGFMLVYFTPCFFVDVSDAYLFDSHMKRQWTIYAGGYFELFLCSIATFIWALTDPGTAVHHFFWIFLLMSGLTSVVVNYNPLIKLDGYYSMADYLEIADLFERSSAYVTGWVKKNVFRLPVDLEEPAPSIRRIFVTYVLLSITYRTLLVVFFLTFLMHVLVGLFGNAGYVLLAAFGLSIFRRPLRGLAAFLRVGVLDKKEVLMTRRTGLIAGGVCASLLVLGAIVPVPVGVQADVVLEPARRAFVRAGTEGVVDRLLVEEGAPVTAGQTLAVLRNDRVTARLAVLEERLDRIGREIATAEDRQDRAVLAARGTEREAVRQEIGEWRRRVEDLTLRAPLAGVVATPRLRDRLGTFLPAGAILCEIAGGGLIARVPVREARIDEIETGQRVAIRLESFAFRTLRGRVTRIAPVTGAALPTVVDVGEPRPLLAADARLPEFSNIEAVVEIDGHEDGPRPGMSGTARIRIGYSSLLRRSARSLHRWVGSRIW